MSGAVVDIAFPVGGLHRGAAFQTQPPYSSPDMLNVRPRDVVEQRGRGGSRPGLTRTHAPLAAQVDMLAEVAIARRDGDARDLWMDEFGGTSLGSGWSSVTGTSGTPAVTDGWPSVGADDGTRGAVLADQHHLTAQPYLVEVAVSYPYGVYGLLVGLSDTPNVTDGTWLKLTLNGAAWSLAVGGTTVASGTKSGIVTGWFRAYVSSTTITVYWCGEVIHTVTGATLHADARVGFTIDGTVDTAAVIAAFRFQFYGTNPGSGFRQQLVAIADGDLSRETFVGIWSTVSSSLDFAAGRRLFSAPHLQKLYIADHGRIAGGTDGVLTSSVLTAASVADWTAIGLTSDMRVVLHDTVGAVTGVYPITVIASGGITLPASGTGTGSWRIERSPKIYDPIANTVSQWTATDGTYPAGCRLICRYRDRIVLAGDPLFPHLWYMSRQGDALDFDYGADASDVQRAVAGQSSDAGTIGDAITALIPHSDDYLIVGCVGSLWVIRGDPAYGGQIDSLSRTVGVVGGAAWSAGPQGETYFLARDGVYMLAPGGQSSPQRLSKDTLPKELQSIDTNLCEAQLEYDPQDNGLHIFVTPVGGSGAPLHWWFTEGAFFPFSLPTTQSPTATVRRSSGTAMDGAILVGGSDGAVRRFEWSCPTDDGTTITSRVDIGAMRLGGQDDVTGCINEVRCTLSDQGYDGNATLGVRVGDTPEAAFRAGNFDTIVGQPGLPRTWRPRARGYAGMLSITSTVPWAFENLSVTVRRRGDRRV